MMIDEVMHEIFHTIMRIKPTLDVRVIRAALFDDMIIAKIDDALDLVFEVVIENERND